MDRSRMSRKPTTPGEILQHEYLAPLEMSQKYLASHIGQDVKVINRIVNGRSAVTAEVALKLAATFRTTPEGAAAGPETRSEERRVGKECS